MGGCGADHGWGWIRGPGSIVDGTSKAGARAGRGARSMMLSVAAAPPGVWTATGMIAAVVLSSTCGEVLTAAAMKSIGDLDEIRARSGMRGAIRAVVTCPLFFAGVFFLALAFFALLFALNHLDLSLV